MFLGSDDGPLALEMQARGSKSNHLGSNNETLVHLVGQLSNPSAALAAVFEAAAVRPVSRELRASIVGEPASARLGNSVVQRAVVRVLAVAQRPMRAPEVRAAVEDLLGHPVSKDSISWCLAAGARGKEQRLERVARGCYRLV